MRGRGRSKEEVGEGSKLGREGREKWKNGGQVGGRREGGRKERMA